MGRSADGAHKVTSNPRGGNRRERRKAGINIWLIISKRGNLVVSVCHYSKHLSCNSECYSLPMGAQMLPYKSCSFKVFVTNISLLKYYHKHFPFEVLPQMLYQRLVGLLQMLQQRFVGLSQMLQQRLVGLSQLLQQRLFTNVAAKGFSQMLQQNDSHKCCSKRL